MSFELNFFVSRHLSTWGFRNRVCLYQKRNHSTFVNISPTVVIDTMNGKVFTSTATWKPIIFFYSKMSKLNFDLCWNHHRFVNISPTVVIILCTLIGLVMLYITTYTFMLGQICTIEHSFLNPLLPSAHKSARIAIISILKLEEPSKISYERRDYESVDEYNLS